MRVSLPLLAGALIAATPALAQAPIPVGQLMDNSGPTSDVGVPYGQGVADALAWVNQRPFVTSNLIGATTLEQLKENIDSVDVTLSAEVLEAINELVGGQLDMIAFTSSSQLTRLLGVARDAGLRDTLIHVLSRMPIAAVGPVIETMLRELGVRTILRPEHNFHLKPLVTVIAAAWQASRPPDGSPSP